MSALRDAATTALTAAELADVPARLPRVTVTREAGRWTWTHGAGLARNIPDSWALPRIYGEHPVRYRDGIDGARGLIVLLPPSDQP